MSYHFFEDTEFAGPSPKDLLRFWDRQPRQLRPKPRTNVPRFTFPDSNEQGVPVKATHSDSLEISNFWNSYYNGGNWKFQCNFKDVQRWMDQGFILLLKQKKQIVATFVCRIVNGGIKCGVQAPAAILDGYVVHPQLRGLGLASIMLAAMDKEIYNTPSMNQSILIWFREHSLSVNALLQTPVGIFSYSYIYLSDIPKHNGTVSKAEDHIVEQVLSSVARNSEFAIISRNYADPDIYWFLVNSTLVGIAYTHRITEEGFVLWEVVFAGNLTAPYFVNLQNSIELAGRQLPCEKGLLFVSNSKSRGNMVSMYSPWISGTSGCLSVHVYNWMPPTFITGDILFAHTCI